MSSQIFYFTGSGNGLSLARGLASRFVAAGERVVLQSIGKILADEQSDNSAVSPEVLPETDCVIVIFPVYFFDVPDAVKSFFSKLHIRTSTRFITISNCGASDFGVVRSLKKTLSSAKIRLDAHYRFILPDNSIIFPTAPALVPSLLAAAETRLDVIARSICENKTVIEETHFSGDGLVGRLMKQYCLKVLGFPVLSADPAKCTRCGICSRVCPAGIIAPGTASVSVAASVPVASRVPSWTDPTRCTTCFACLHNCPSEAVTFRKQKTRSSFRYRNPSVSASDLFVR